MTEALGLSDFLFVMRSGLNCTAPTQLVRVRHLQLKGFQDRWTLTREREREREAAAERLGGLPREVKRTAGAGEEGEERRDEDERQVTGERSRRREGPSNSCYWDEESQKCSSADELQANAALTSRYT